MNNYYYVYTLAISMNRIAIHMISVLVLQQNIDSFHSFFLRFRMLHSFHFNLFPTKLLLKKKRCYRCLMPRAHLQNSHIKCFSLFTYLKMCRENGFQKGFGIL